MTNYSDQSIEVIQLNEMMHVDIKVGIDMQSCPLPMRAVAAGPVLHFICSVVFRNAIDNDPGCVCGFNCVCGGN